MRDPQRLGEERTLHRPRSCGGLDETRDRRCDPAKGSCWRSHFTENYPDLKANENFLNLQNELVETENYLQFARRFYNGAVRQFNNRVETVPNNIIAGWFGFQQRGFFQKASDDVANVPLVELGQVE